MINKNSHLESTCTKEKGFSAVELLMVVVVLAILTAISIPIITSSMSLRRLDTFVSKTADKLMVARINAVKRNRTSWVKIDPVNRTTEIQTTDDLGNTVNIKPAELLPASITITSSIPVEFRFDSLGRLYAGSQTATFQLANTGGLDSKDLSVSPAGKVTVSEMYEAVGGGDDDEEDDEEDDDD